MKSTVFRLIYLLAGVLLAIGCRQENVILNFEVNTQGATATLQQIMYNEMQSSAVYGAEKRMEYEI